jgi:hypothetical protein
MSDVPYEEGFKRGYLGLAFIERYAEYSVEDISCKKGYTNGGAQAKLELDKWNGFVDNMKRERKTA